MGGVPNPHHRSELRLVLPPACVSIGIAAASSNRYTIDAAVRLAERVMSLAKIKVLIMQDGNVV